MATSFVEDQLTPSVRDRRGTRRHATVLLVGQVRRGGKTAVCLVHDISPEGMLARFTEVPVLGEEVEVAVRGLASTTATVRWVTGYKAGLAFAEQQDLGGVLGRATGKVSRAPRFDVALATELMAGSARLVVELVDLSPGGAKLIVDAALQPGTPVQLALPGSAAPIPGTVCWYREARTGLRFTYPLEMATLARIIALDDGREPPERE